MDGPCSGSVGGAQLKCFVWHLEGECEKWEGSSWRRLSGCISFKASGFIVCVASLLAKSFVVISVA